MRGNRECGSAGLEFGKSELRVEKPQPQPKCLAIEFHCPEDVVDKEHCSSKLHPRIISPSPGGRVLFCAEEAASQYLQLVVLKLRPGRAIGHDVRREIEPMLQSASVADFVHHGDTIRRDFADIDHREP